jgi:hypothetical protein
MPQQSKNENAEQEPLKQKLEDLIKKKSDENSALKKLLDGLNKADDRENHENN